MMEPVAGLEPINIRRTALHPETANFLTHAFGFCLSLFAAAQLIFTVLGTGDVYRIVGCTIFAASLVALYAASTLSHAFEDPVRRRFYRMVDQVCIFLLIVGTYTPFGLVHAREHGWWLVLATMWTCALVGIAMRVLRPERTLPPILFIILAWCPLCTMGHAYSASHLGGLALVFAGGAAYMGGVWFLLNDDRHPYYHAAWHVSTITGSAMHFLFVLYYVASPAV